MKNLVIPNNPPKKLADNLLTENPPLNGILSHQNPDNIEKKRRYTTPNDFKNKLLDPSQMISEKSTAFSLANNTLFTPDMTSHPMIKINPEPLSPERKRDPAQRLMKRNTAPVGLTIIVNPASPSKHDDSPNKVENIDILKEGLPIIGKKLEKKQPIDELDKLLESLPREENPSYYPL